MHIASCWKASVCQNVPAHLFEALFGRWLYNVTAFGSSRHFQMKLTVRFDQTVESESAISPARVGQNPNGSALHARWLQSPGDVSLA